MKLIVLAAAALVCTSQVAFAKLEVLKKVELANPYSFSCASEAAEKTGSTSSISFYIGGYSVDSNGTKTFNYYTAASQFWTTAALCQRAQLIYSTVDVTTDYEKYGVSLLVDESNQLVGIEDFSNRKLILVSRP